MTQLAALIFDVDGTLAETEALHRDSFNDAFTAAGLPWHWDEDLYDLLLGVTGGKERIAHYQRMPGVTLPRNHPLDAAAIAALHADKTERYTQAVASGTLGLRPGVARLLHAAHAAGIPCAIATTTTHANVAALLAAAGPTLPPFATIGAGDAVSAKKPAPDVYQLVLRTLALPPGSCIAIEDSANGLASARAANIPCIVTQSRYGGAGPFPGAAAILTHLGDPQSPATCRMGPELPTTGPNAGLVTLDWLAQLLPQ